MIVVRLTSGLGNQMYQYSFYRLMKDLYPGTTVKIDTTWFNANNDHHGYEIEKLFKNAKVKKAGFFDLFKVTGVIPNFLPGKAGRIFEKIRRYPNRIIRIFTERRTKQYTIDELSDDNIFEKVMNLDISKDWYIMGFFIEEAYLSSYMPKIDKHIDKSKLNDLMISAQYGGRLEKVRKYFKFKDIPYDEFSNDNYLKDIKTSESVSIHVRRGDYLSEQYSSKFIALGEDYYKKAVDYIKKNVENPRFFIFSDDAEYIGKAFSWLENKVIVTGNDGDKSYRDMQLMSKCKHNIIANSTFSQWGAILNSNPKKIVVYPEKYMVGCDTEIKRLPGYVRISL